MSRTPVESSIVALVASLCAVALSACDVGSVDSVVTEPVVAAGDLGGPCYGNGTCNGDLVCNAGEVCVAPDEPPPPPVDPCASVGCSGHGTCVADGSTPTCSCAAGYHASPSGLACIADTVNTCATPPIVLDTDNEVYTLGCDLEAGGTAFEIRADNVTLDLNGHVVTYDATANVSPVHAVYAPVGVTGVKVQNGTIVQGAGGSAESHAIFIYGASWSTGHELHDLVIRTHGWQSMGIEASSQGYSFNAGKIYRTYVEVHSDTDAMDGYGATGISLTAMNDGGIEIHDNIVVAGHQGIGVSRIGEVDGDAAAPSRIYANRVQPERRPGCKAPYGIAVAGQSHNLHIYDNQIVSDNGRGIIFDGNGVGVSVGASGNFVHHNHIDVQYSDPSLSGPYVENNVYGVRDRFASGDNTFEDNVILVTNDVTGEAVGFDIGSDVLDPLMENIVMQRNTILARQGLGSWLPVVNHFEGAQSITFTDNRYIGELETTPINVGSLVMSGNTPLVPAETSPTAPVGLRLARFLDSYLLEWDPSSEADVYEYVVYRDGARLPISPRGGTFYVDVGIGGSHSYAVSALTLSGVESAPCAAVASSTARNAWW